MSNGPLIGIISDSHDNKQNIIHAVDIFNDSNCSLVIHAGDFVAPFTAHEFKRLSCPFIGVFGNNDGERKGLATLYADFGEIHTAPFEFEHSGKRFVVMHEPYYLDRYLDRQDIDIVIYGHTHKIDIRHGAPLVINPGESCSWLTGRSTIVLLDPVTMDTNIIDIE